MLRPTWRTYCDSGYPLKSTRPHWTEAKGVCCVCVVFFCVFFLRYPCFVGKLAEGKLFSACFVQGAPFTYAGRKLTKNLALILFDASRWNQGHSPLHVDPPEENCGAARRRGCGRGRTTGSAVLGASAGVGTKAAMATAGATDGLFWHRTPLDK